MKRNVAMVIGERVRVSLTNVLLAVDFSETSLLAFPFATSIAHHYGGKVFLAHITEDSDRPQIGREARHMLDTMLMAAEEGALASIAGASYAPHVAVSDYGSVYTTLLTVASKSNVDLVVIGTHGRQGIRKLLHGSKAQEIVSLSSKPVLVVGPKVSTKPEFKRILYVTNFSPAAIHALPVADSLRATFHSSLILLHVNDCDGDETPADAVPRTNKFLEDARAAGYEDLTDNVEVVVEFGARAERILEVARARHSDLIVIGVQTHKGVRARLAAHLPGSVAFEVISRAHCPVLTVSCSTMEHN
ncbi:MAG: universal stress protein [Acidobacteriaceae bacterium]